MERAAPERRADRDIRTLEDEPALIGDVRSAAPADRPRSRRLAPGPMPRAPRPCRAAVGVRGKLPAS